MTTKVVAFFNDVIEDNFTDQIQKIENQSDYTKLNYPESDDESFKTNDKKQV